MSPLKINPAGTEEVIQVYLDPVKHPIAYAAKKKELINCGMSEKEAEDYILRNPFIRIMKINQLYRRRFK